MVNFVYPEELNFFIESIRPFQLNGVGSSKWLEMHEMIIKLSQQAVVEAAEHREEEVKEFLISHDKLKVLIHEAYCISLWKTRVLPHLLEIDPNPQATFLIYTVFFHEAAAIALLDIALFHVSGCEALQDVSLDLVDYCAQAIAQLIGLVSMGYLENESKLDVDESVLTEMERQKRDLIFKIGLRCISILNYLADNLNSLPVSTLRRLVVTHDIPWLMVDVLCFRPWQRHIKKGIQKFIDEKWTLIQADNIANVIKPEAQAWFCLRQLIFNPKVMEVYFLNEDRCKQLSKCQGLLLDTLLDQLPPLVQLKEYLARLCISGGTDQKNQKFNLVIEEICEIRENLIIEAERNGGFSEIAHQQESIFLNNDKQKIFDLAQRLNNAYNIDLLTEFEQTAADENENNFTNGVDESDAKGNLDTTNKCGKCFSKAEKKCANCKQVYYCSRKCQLDDWANHKSTCIKI